MASNAEDYEAARLHVATEYAASLESDLNSVSEASRMVPFWGLERVHQAATISDELAKLPGTIGSEVANHHLKALDAVIAGTIAAHQLGRLDGIDFKVEGPPADMHVPEEVDQALEKFAERRDQCWWYAAGLLGIKYRADGGPIPILSKQTRTT